MIVLMHADATEDQIDAVMTTIQSRQLKSLRLPGDENLAIGVASAIPPDVRPGLADQLQTLGGVKTVVHISRPYKLVSREFQAVSTVINVRGVEIGGEGCVVMAGPCAVESRDQIFRSAEAVKSAGARFLRGGAFKPRTSPYSFQGLQKEGLELLKEVGEAMDIATITEVVDPHDVELVAEYVDMLQIGARNMQNFPLLVAAGKSGHPTLLKRGPSATLDEFLFAAEYLLHHGNNKVVLCERGVHPLDKTYTRNTLDLNAVPVLKEITHLPVIVDPSHGIGHARHVPAMSKAALAAGADGLIVEVHPNPREALSDGQQSLAPEAFSALMKDLSRLALALDRRIV